MSIRYKVVKITRRGERRSAVLLASSDFSLEYPVNSIVKAPKNTLGIMTFDARNKAQEFIDWHLSTIRIFAIIKVRGIGRGRKVEWVLSCTSSQNIDWLCDKIGTIGVARAIKTLLFGTERHAPKGTMCYQAVEVLE